MIASLPWVRTKSFERQFLAGEIELEFTPQGTWLKKASCRAAADVSGFSPKRVSAPWSLTAKKPRFNGEVHVSGHTLLAPTCRSSKAYMADRVAPVYYKTAATLSQRRQGCRVSVVEV